MKWILQFLCSLILCATKLSFYDLVLCAVVKLLWHLNREWKNLLTDFIINEHNPVLWIAPWLSSESVDSGEKCERKHAFLTFYHFSAHPAHTFQFLWVCTIQSTLRSLLITTFPDNALHTLLKIVLKRHTWFYYVTCNVGRWVSWNTVYPDCCNFMVSAMYLLCKESYGIESFK